MKKLMLVVIFCLGFYGVGFGEPEALEAVQIPPEAIPGECGFQIVARFVCNPLDLIDPRMVSTKPITFKVLRYDQ